MLEELEVLDKNKTWELVSLPPGSWLQVGLHSEAKPGRSGGALQSPIGSKMIQSDLWHRL
jgi:hypothetical protein